jgi:OmpA-OmpF porin, OOP family
MKRDTQRFLIWLMAGFLLMAPISVAQEKPGDGMTKMVAGQKVKVAGLIVKRDADSFVLRNERGQETVVKLSAATAIKERKVNPFRESRTYQPSQLVRGLSVEVEGLGDMDGSLAARDIKLTNTQYQIANSVESRVTPVEGRLGQTEERLSRSEQNAQHLSGQVEELREISNAARGGAKAAQETADSALAGVDKANERIAAVDQTTNARITAVDDYDVKDQTVIHFKVGSAVLSTEAKSQLEQLVKEARKQKGYVVEVTGFASSDGNEAFNRVLSRQRADAVVQYLADSMVPLRRIVTPFGFGQNMPVADNSTRTGREENRRVEVKILASKGITAGESQTSAANRIQK